LSSLRPQAAEITHGTRLAIPAGTSGGDHAHLAHSRSRRSVQRRRHRPRRRARVKRSGERQFNLTGAIAPPYGKPFTIGRFPMGDHRLDVQLWLTDR
jgi:hypothetical protein